MICKKIKLGKTEKDTKAEMTVYLQPVGGEFPNISKRPVILILPGGGYRMCSEREADPIAFPFLAAGYQAAVLYYTVGEGAKWPEPLEDYEAAMEYLTEKADEWNLDMSKAAVIGFSAGGHLAGYAASKALNRPRAAILGYAVTEGPHINWRLPGAPDVIDAVNDQTCPCFLFATRDDQTVPVRNTIRFAEALDENGIPFECHIYSKGIHGIATADPSVLYPTDLACPRAAQWVKDCLGWLDEVMHPWDRGKTDDRSEKETEGRQGTC